MVDPEKPLLTQYTRDADGWRYLPHTALSATVSATVESTAFDPEIPLRDVYALALENAE